MALSHTIELKAFDGTTIIPISKVGFGFGTGGSDLPMPENASSTTKPNLFGGGAGAGISIKPVSSPK